MKLFKKIGATLPWHEDTNRLVLSGTLSVILVRGLAASAGLGMNVAVARLLPLSEFGVFVFVMAWLQIAGTIACVGSDVVATRFVAERLAAGDSSGVRAVVRWGAWVSIATGVIVAFTSIGIFQLLFNDWPLQHREASMLAMAGIPLLAFTLFGSGALRGLKRVATGAAVEGLVRPALVTLLVLGLATVFHHYVGIVIVCLVIVLSQATAAFWVWRALKRFFVGINALASEGAQGWMSVAIPVAVMNITGVVIANVDVLFVGAMIGPDQAGIYRPAVQLAALVSFGLAASNGIVAPLVAEMYSAGRLAELRRMLRFSAGLIALVGFLGVAGMALLGNFALGIFGEEYRVAYPALLILLAGQAVNALCGPTGYVMTMTGHQRQAMTFFVTSAGVNVGLNMALIPTYGIMGAAVTNAISLSFWNLAILIFLRKKIGIDCSIIPVFSKKIMIA